MLIFLFLNEQIGILAQRSRAAKVFFQNENPEAFDTLLRFVKSGISSENSLLGKEKAKQERSELKKIQASKNTNVSFQVSRLFSRTLSLDTLLHTDGRKEGRKEGSVLFIITLNTSLQEHQHVIPGE